jgi:hypothetical protein
MKRWLALVAFLAGGLAAALADDAKFSQQISPGDFSAAGLSKLTPEELARLDQLVQAYEGTAVAAQAAAEARARKAETDAKAARAAQAAAEKRAQGFLARTRALLLPGTEIEYQELDSRVVGTIANILPYEVITLENGQRWQVEKDAYSYYGDPVKNPKARIVPAPFSGFKIEIDGFPDARVRLVGKRLDDSPLLH